MHLVAAQNVSNDYLVPVHDRANTRDSPVDTVVIGDFVRPDQPAAVLLDCEEIAGPIGEVNGITVHGWSSRNVATRCEHPFRLLQPWTVMPFTSPIGPAISSQSRRTA